MRAAHYDGFSPPQESSANVSIHAALQEPQLEILKVQHTKKKTKLMFKSTYSLPRQACLWKVCVGILGLIGNGMSLSRASTHPFLCPAASHQHGPPSWGSPAQPAAPLPRSSPIWSWCKPSQLHEGTWTYGYLTWLRSSTSSFSEKAESKQLVH